MAFDPRLFGLVLQAQRDGAHLDSTTNGEKDWRSAGLRHGGPCLGLMQRRRAGGRRSGGSVKQLKRVPRVERGNDWGKFDGFRRDSTEFTRPSCSEDCKSVIWKRKLGPETFCSFEFLFPP